MGTQNIHALLNGILSDEKQRDGFLHERCIDLVSCLQLRLVSDNLLQVHIPCFFRHFG